MSSTTAERVCTECGETKPMEQFSLHSRQGTTRRAKCKPCSSAIQKDWRYRYYPRLDTDEPAVLTPLATQWELSCQLCGDCREFRWTAEEARTGVAVFAGSTDQVPALWRVARVAAGDAFSQGPRSGKG